METDLARSLLFSAVFCFLLGEAGSSYASNLPAGFVLAGQETSFNPGDDMNTRLASLEIGPDGNLWIFNAPGEIQTIDPVDGIFFNGNDTLSTRFGSTSNGAVFTPDGDLLSYDAFTANASLRNAVDGIFFNGNDVVTNFT